MATSIAVGIDIGGTGIKASAVNLRTGRLTMARDRVATPEPATPEHVIESILGLLHDVVVPAANRRHTIGVGFPGAIKAGVVKTAAHLDPSWVGTDAAALLSSALGHPTHVLNDADAAGLAEVRLGAGAGSSGVVLMVTLGTGIGTGLFHNGVLVPNAQLGHLQIDGKEAEARAAASVRDAKGLSWKRWGRRVNTYLLELENLFWPELFVIGGGVSEHFDRFGGQLTCLTPVVPATLGNDAGIIGAALWSAEQARQPARRIATVATAVEPMARRARK